MKTASHTRPSWVRTSSLASAVNSETRKISARRPTDCLIAMGSRGICMIAIIALFAHIRKLVGAWLSSSRSQSGGGEPLNLARLGAHALFYANAVLAIWYFRNWIYLLALDEGESASVPVDVIWDFVAVMIPLVLATTGRRLWQRGA